MNPAQVFSEKWADLAAFPAGEGGEIRLRALNGGTSADAPLVVVFPGIEGSGESCSELIEWVSDRATRDSRAFRFLLVDYSAEKCASFEGLLNVIESALLEHSGQTPSVFWSQSFGNLIAASLAARARLKVDRHFFLSPFGDLPPALLKASALLSAAVSKKLNRRALLPFWIFICGPARGLRHHGFFRVLSNANPADFARRLGWAASLDMAGVYSRVRVPSVAWFGKRDRLIFPARQVRFFKRVSTSSSIEVREVANAGHMLFPQLIGEDRCEEFYRFLVR